MINDLNSIMAKDGEEPTALVDRLEKMCVTIKAIDSAQLPTDLSLVGVLKKAISLRFKTLNSGVKLSANEWTLDLLKKKVREWKMENEILAPQNMQKAEAHFTPAGRGRAPNSFKNRNKPREPRKDKGGARPSDKERDKNIECFNCHRKGHRTQDCWSPKREENDRGGGKRGQNSASSGSGGYESGGDSRRARRDDDSAAGENNSLEIYKKKQFPLKSAMKGAGKWRKQSESGGKYGAGRNSSRENFMDAEGDFFDSRSHFNWEQVRHRIDMALHTITPSPRMYCIDTGSITFIVNHLIVKYRNLRN